jgi:alpha-beta hydrolase superfamily lysophospholipase
MVPFSQGPVAEFKQFMATLQADVLADPALESRPVAILGHSRGGLIGRAYLGDPDVKANSSREYPNVKGLVTLSSPHAGSNMAWLDDRIVHLLEQVLSAALNLPLEIRRQILSSFATLRRAPKAATSST